jgi:hypothetical protein
LPVGILTVLLILIAATFRPQADPGFVENGLTCLKNGLTYAIPRGLLFWLLVRRGAILFPKLIGAAVGGLAGLIGLRACWRSIARTWTSFTFWYGMGGCL